MTSYSTPRASTPSSATNPLRYPEQRSRTVMTRRAWWLVLLNLVLPGSVQVIAGNRRLGRLGLLSTFTLWLLAIAGVLLWFFARGVLLTAVANPWVLLAAQVVLFAYAALWVILTLDTLRLVQLVRVVPGARFLVAVVAIVGLGVAAGGAGYGALVAGSARSAITAVFDDRDYVPPSDGRYNILLLGADAGEDRMGLRPDSITVASIDADTGATVLIGVPRNFEYARFTPDSPLWGPWPNGYDCGHECLISYLYTYGEEHPELYPDAVERGSHPGLEAMRDAVGGVLGLEIPFYVIVDMQGFENLVDALGGITVTVPERTAVGPVTSPTPFYYVEAGEQHMDGAEALWYARTRFDSTDFERMKRQRIVQSAIVAQFTPANVLTRFQEVAAAGSSMVTTDIPEVMVGVFLSLAEKARGIPLVELELIPPEFPSDAPDYAKIEAALADAIARAVPPDPQD